MRQNDALLRSAVEGIVDALGSPTPPFVTATLEDLWERLRDNAAVGAAVLQVQALTQIFRHSDATARAVGERNARRHANTAGSIGALVECTQAIATAVSPSYIVGMLVERSQKFASLGLVVDALIDATVAEMVDPRDEEAAEQVAALSALPACRATPKEQVHHRIKTSILIDGIPTVQKATLSHSGDDPLWTVTRDMKGRCATAATDLLAGTTLVVESPLVAVADQPMATCASCLTFSPRVYPMHILDAVDSRLRGEEPTLDVTAGAMFQPTLFCTVDCCRKWREGPMAPIWEKAGRQPFFRLWPTDVQLAWLLSQSSENTTVACPEDVRKRWDSTSQAASLVSAMAATPLEPTPKAPLGAAEAITAVLALATQMCDTPREAERFRKAIQQVQANACTITYHADRLAPPIAATHDAPTVRVARGIYPVAALFNHHCAPNAFMSVVGNPHTSSAYIVVRTVVPVAKGEELFVSYENLDRWHVHSTSARVHALRAKYGFVCRCSFCVGHPDEALTQNQQEAMKLAADLYQKGKRLLREGDASTAVQVLQQSGKMVMERVCPSPAPPMMMIPKTLEAIAFATAAQSGTSSSEVARYLKEALTVSTVLHSDVFVARIKECARLATLVDGPEKDALVDRAVSLLEIFFERSPQRDIDVALLKSISKPSNSGASATYVDQPSDRPPAVS